MFKQIANDGRILLGVYGMTLLLGTSGFRLFEGDAYSFIDCLYWSSTTITSTGYGDIAPKTDGGKIFAVLFQQIGIVIVLALTIAWVLGKVNADLFSHEEQEDAEQDRETIKAEIHALREELMRK
jgi:voltage-gated potassium channel